jgi:hypothetical protein
MNRNTPAFLFATLALLLLHQGCTPEEIDPVAPEIGWISINATEVMSATTPLTVTLSYRDHQGDIGWNDPDVHALQVQDARLENPDTYHIPPLTPGGVELDIDGTFVIQLPALFLLGNGGDEQTRLTFRLSDRAGNASNEVQSPLIFITDTL